MASNPDVREVRELLDIGDLKSARISTVADGAAIRVDLDDAPSPCAALLHVLNRIDVVDMVAGRYRKTDRQLRLSVRGKFPGGPMVVAVAPFTGQRQIELIEDQVRSSPQRCRELVTRLVALEQRY